VLREKASGPPPVRNRADECAEELLTVLEKERPYGKRKRIVGVLDIGTSKIACLIAAVDPELPPPGTQAGGLRIIGIGHHGSRGVKAGVVTDLDEAEQAVRGTVARAERMAGVRLEEVRVSVSCGRLRSQNFAASTDVERGVVREDEIARVLAGGQAYAEREGRTLIHLNTIGLRLDGAPAGRDPRGMAARGLSADLHAVTADEAPLRNLLLVIERCYLMASSLVPAPFASALAATSEEERRLGVTLIDIGGGTTTVAMFAEGQFIHANAAAQGGDQITFDIARALHTPLAEAERIKALYGTLVSAQSDEHDDFSYPLTGEEEGSMHRMTKAQLAEIIRPRVEGLIRHVRERIQECEVAEFASRCVVLTGGTSQLAGMADFVANELGRPVRVAPPCAVSGLPPVVSSPAFSTVVGLLLPTTAEGRVPVSVRARDVSAHGYLDRVGEWLREGF
jgi:cell division protein FtsA